MTLSNTTTTPASCRFLNDCMQLLIKPLVMSACLLLLAACNETRRTDSDLLTSSATIDTAEKPARSQPGTATQAAAADQLEYEQFETLYLTSTTTHSIWPRIHAGFQLTADIQQPALASELDWFANHPAYIERVMQRADPFLFYILEETEKRGLPTELVLLPIVESAYQPFAYSHGRAAGIWQFIPSTGNIYGLKQNWWYDGRRDIHASTQAALDYLENLNKQFDGDWMLALAAYNSGPGTVRRAIKKNQQRNRSTDFWQLDLPKETRAYVPKLLALKEIIANPELYEVSLRCIANVPGFRQVQTQAQLDLALAAELADIDLETLYNYNPGFNRWATDPDGPHKLLLPADAAELFEKNYALLAADEHLRWTRHQIKPGETLSEIAQKYNTSATHLKKVNDLSGNTIRAGKYLLIPVASKNDRSYALTSSQRQKSLQNTQQGNTSTRIEHQVKSGESFWEISRKYNVDMHKLAKWNGMAVKDPLKPGQKLVVWSPAKSGLVKQAAITTHNPNSTVKSINYTVRNGDSLSSIASRYRVDIKDLHRWNSIKGKYIQPGQRLKLYIDVTEQSSNQS